MAPARSIPANIKNPPAKQPKKLGLPLAIMQDLPGQKNRTGKLAKRHSRAKENADFILTTRAILGDENQVSVDLPYLPNIVKPGDTIFLDDGAMRLRVIATNNTDVICRVLAGGSLGEYKGINIPGVTWGAPTITKEDWNHLLFGLKHDVDFVALSFIRQAKDVLKVRRFLKEK